jgi:catechol 2,3-dioxygenase-like lactoylglutathione lyase family enzyme
MQPFELDAVVFDCRDPERLAQFWQGLLGGELKRDQHGDIELHGAVVRLDFTRVPEEKSVKGRLHLDLRIRAENRAEAVERAVALGATKADDVYDGGRWQVMRDVEGNEFCFVRGGGASPAPG